MNIFNKFLVTKKNTRNCLFKITDPMYRSENDLIIRLIKVPGVLYCSFLQKGVKIWKKKQARVKKNWAIGANM